MDNESVLGSLRDNECIFGRMVPLGRCPKSDNMVDNESILGSLRDNKSVLGSLRDNKSLLVCLRL